MKRLMTLLFLWFGTAAIADELAAPTGPVILTVTGNIMHTNGDGIAQFDQDMLAELTQRMTTTQTPWYDATHKFSGPLGAAILDAVGATGETLNVIALNDYAAEVPTQDLRDHSVIFATHLDDQRMSVRDKGPLFMIYPFDEDPDLFNEIYFGRSVWQIARIDVQD